MTATKKATKKVAKKAAAKKAAKIVLKDDTLYVVSVRDKLFMWKPYVIYETYEEAHSMKKQLETNSVLSFSYAKVTPVKLVQ